MCWMKNEFSSLHGIYHPELPPVLERLARTPAMTRLDLVGMNCGCEYTAFPRFRRGRSYTRLIHSLGVGRIVWHFTRDPAQAAAGLLHDVAAPVFAHVVDFLNGDHLSQESTEAGTRSRIQNSPELMAALDAFGLCVEQTADYHVYPIADNDSPRLSADRLEYTLGNALSYEFLTLDEIRALYEDLRVGLGEDQRPELAFQSRDKALIFARTALRCARVYVSHEDRYAMQILSELLAEAIRQKVLTRRDLDTTEPAVIRKLEASALAPAWTRFCRLSRIETASEPPDPRPWRQIPAKKRYIDPLVLGQGRVSALDSAFSRDLAAYLAESQAIWVLAADADGRSLILPSP